MTDKEKLKQAINILKKHCESMGEYNACGQCLFKDCCQNRWGDYETLAQCMNGLLKDMTTAEKVENTDFGAAYDAVEKLICNNFEECKGCPFYNRKNDCPLGQLNSVLTAY